MRLARGRQSHALVKAHGDPLDHSRRVLCEVVQDDGSQAEERLIGDEPAKVDAESWLEAAARAETARADADVLDRDAIPPESRAVVVVVAEPLPERLPLLAIDQKIDALQLLTVEEVARQGARIATGEDGCRAHTGAQQCAD